MEHERSKKPRLYVTCLSEPQWVQSTGQYPLSSSPWIFLFTLVLILSVPPLPELELHCLPHPVLFLDYLTNFFLSGHCLHLPLCLFRHAFSEVFFSPLPGARSCSFIFVMIVICWFCKPRQLYLHVMQVICSLCQTHSGHQNNDLCSLCVSGHPHHIRTHVHTDR